MVIVPNLAANFSISGNFAGSMKFKRAHSSPTKSRKKKLSLRGECLRERERERKREIDRERRREKGRETERDRQRDRQRDRDRERETETERLQERGKKKFEAKICRSLKKTQAEKKVRTRGKSSMKLIFFSSFN